VGRSDRGSKVLAAGIDGAEEPGGGRYVHRLRGWPEGISRIHCDSVSGGTSAVVRGAPGARIAELCLLETAQGRGCGSTADLRASTVEEAEQRLDEFAAKWDGAYPTISQMWRRNWEHLTPFFAYPADIRKVIYTTHAVESLNMSLRKVIKTRGSFPNQEAAMKLPFLALEHIAKKWTMPVQNWKAALQRFAILLGDRVPKAELA
jgi:Transposase, Mutator family